MAQPKLKFFGSLSLDNISKAVKTISSKVENHATYGKQIKVTGAQWDDDGISIDVYNNETKTSLKLGNLKVSQFDNEKIVEKEDEEKDTGLPF